MGGMQRRTSKKRTLRPRLSSHNEGGKKRVSGRKEGLFKRQVHKGGRCLGLGPVQRTSYAEKGKGWETKEGTTQKKVDLKRAMVVRGPVSANKRGLYGGREN